MATWVTLSDGQKRKWISLSTNYPRMTAPEQTKLHARMEQWAALSPRQREQARLNFADIQKIAPQQKNEQWQAYQALSPEEKLKLVKSAQPKPPRTAIAARPAPPDKLNRLPPPKNAGHIGLTAPITSPTNKTMLTIPMQAASPPKSTASAVAHDTQQQ